MMVCACYNAISILSQMTKIIMTITESVTMTIIEYVLPAKLGVRHYRTVYYYNNYLSNNNRCFFFLIII